MMQRRLWLVLLGSSVLMSILLVAPADAQTYIPYWDPDTVTVLESDREVVLTLKKHGPGHVRYQTENGRCAQHVASPTSTNCRPPEARAPDDYGAVSGDLIFTEAGSKTITIAIVDDDLDEGSEAFSVYAHEGDRASVGTGSIGTVWIIDDDSSSSSGSSSPAQSSSKAGTGSQAGTGGATPPSQTENRPADVSRPDRAAASTELQPGPGFELIGSDLVSGPAASARLPEDKGGITTTVFLVLAAVIVLGGGAWIWRRRSSW